MGYLECDECGEPLIQANMKSKYVLCPNGHGRLKPVTKQELRCISLRTELPEAVSLGKGRYEIKGHAVRYNMAPSGSIDPNRVEAFYRTSSGGTKCVLVAIVKGR